MNKIFHEYTDEIVCPYCGYEHSDSWEWGDSGDSECNDCEKKFTFEKHIRIDYSTRKIEQPEQSQESEKDSV